MKSPAHNRFYGGTDSLSPSISEELRYLAETPELDHDVAEKLRDLADATEDLADALRQILDILERPIGKRRRSPLPSLQKPVQRRKGPPGAGGNYPAAFSAPLGARSAVCRSAI